MSRTPTEVIEDALRKLPATQLFTDEKSAQAWVSATSLGLLRHKLSLMQLTPEEREQADPIEAGYIHAKDMGTRPRRQRIPWIDRLLDVVAESTFCEVMPLSGTMSSWLIGRHTDRQVALRVLGALVPTAERLGQDAYLREYHAQRRAGNVEAARGFKDIWLEQYVESVRGGFALQRQEVEREHGQVGVELLTGARLDVVQYMNDNFLPTRGNKTERLRAK